MVEVTPRQVAGFIIGMFFDRPDTTFRIGAHDDLLFRLIEHAVESSGASSLTGDGVEIIPKVTAKIEGRDEVWYEVNRDHRSYALSETPSGEELLRRVGFTDNFFKYFK